MVPAAFMASKGLLAADIAATPAYCSGQVSAAFKAP